MAKNSRAFMDAIELAKAQCKTDREFVPLVRYLLTQMDAKRATRVRKVKAVKAVEAPGAQVRG
jgi:hypothetical protein